MLGKKEGRKRGEEGRGRESSVYNSYQLDGHGGSITTVRGSLTEVTPNLEDGGGVVRILDPVQTQQATTLDFSTFSGCRLPLLPLLASVLLSSPTKKVLTISADVSQSAAALDRFWDSGTRLIWRHAAVALPSLQGIQGCLPGIRRSVVALAGVRHRDSSVIITIFSALWAI